MPGQGTLLKGGFNWHAVLADLFVSRSMFTISSIFHHAKACPVAALGQFIMSAESYSLNLLVDSS